MMNKIIKTLKQLGYLIIAVLSKLLFKKRNRWVFGAWFGTSFSDNSKYLYLKVLKDYKEIEAVWIIKDKDEIKHINSLGGKALLYGSFAANCYVATADVVFMTHNYVDLSPIYLISKAYKVQLWHGVAFKKIGRDAVKDNNLNIFESLKSKIINVWEDCDLYIAPSEEYGSKVKSAFNAPDNKILKVGQPRNDMFFSENTARNKFPNKKIITYMPTFRDNKDFSFDFSKLKSSQEEALNSVLNKYNAVIIQKKHFVNASCSKFKNSTEENVINLNKVDTQELLISTDMLITDYSSCYFDFLLLDRPIIHFVYDYKYYSEKDRGVYYNIEDVCGGKICFDFNSLLKSIEDYLSNPNVDSDQRDKARKRFVTYDDGNCSDKIIKYIMGRC
ncbi:MAG: putative CDP-glycerol:glycerophosphate glycerophosphotransferase [Clostridiaceae bacterium]|nr:putative CDP-glycerol:glycerophosphate glycerophosphotransferase [Clostridiaceae bacterium]